MFVRMVSGVAVVASLLIACSSGDENEGGSCTSNNDCGGNLVCQPIQGRQSDFCCPTPPTTSSHASCQPAN
jgi:hypothetical protein